MPSFDSLTKNQQSKIRVWENKGDISGSNLKDLEWTAIEHKDIADFINERYTNDSSKKSHYSVLAFMCKEYDKEKEAKKYSQLASNLQHAYEEEEKLQKVKPSRVKNYITWDELIAKRKELKEIFEKNEDDIANMYKYLIICLYSYIPPIRLEYSNMELIDKKPPKNENNYIWLDDGEYKVVINKDKVSSTYGRAVLPIESETLTKLIKKTFKLFKRKYLISQIKDGDKPLTKQGMERLLYQMFEPKRVSVDIYRSVYVTKKYSENINLKQKEELAKKMRHSVAVAEKTYKKIIPDDSDDEEEEKEVKQKEYFDLKKYMKEYQKDHSEDIRKNSQKYYDINKEKVLRRKILANLNKYGNTRQPTEKSIQKYDLKYNAKSKTWK